MKSSSCDTWPHQDNRKAVGDNSMVTLVHISKAFDLFTFWKVEILAKIPLHTVWNSYTLKWKLFKVLIFSLCRNDLVFYHCILCHLCNTFCTLKQKRKNSETSRWLSVHWKTHTLLFFRLLRIDSYRYFYFSRNYINFYQYTFLSTSFSPFSKQTFKHLKLQLKLKTFNKDDCSLLKNEHIYFLKSISILFSV